MPKVPDVVPEEIVDRKECSGCGTEKLLSEFHPVTKGRLGRAARCKSCEVKRAREQAARRRAGDLQTQIPAQKSCSLCRQIKPAAEFSRAAAKATGLSSRCKVCLSDAAAQRRYGMSRDERVALAARQGGACAICRRRRPLVPDHCHSTGSVRGLLCRRCNPGLGYFGDDPKLLAAAIQYLQGATS